MKWRKTSLGNLWGTYQDYQLDLNFQGLDVLWLICLQIMITMRGLIQSKKKRVSFANVRRVRKFNSKPETKEDFKTASYDEAFSTSSDSFEMSLSESCAKSSGKDELARDEEVAKAVIDFILNENSSEEDEPMDIIEYGTSDILSSTRVQVDSNHGLKLNKTVNGEFDVFTSLKSQHYSPVNISGLQGGVLSMNNFRQGKSMVNDEMEETLQPGNLLLQNNSNKIVSIDDFMNDTGRTNPPYMQSPMSKVASSDVVNEICNAFLFDDHDGDINNKEVYVTGNHCKDVSKTCKKSTHSPLIPVVVDLPRNEIVNERNMNDRCFIFPCQRNSQGGGASFQKNKASEFFAPKAVETNLSSGNQPDDKEFTGYLQNLEQQTESAANKLNNSDEVEITETLHRELFQNKQCLSSEVSYRTSGNLSMDLNIKHDPSTEMEITETHGINLPKNNLFCTIKNDEPTNSNLIESGPLMFADKKHVQPKRSILKTSQPEKLNVLHKNIRKSFSNEGLTLASKTESVGIAVVQKSIQGLDSSSNLEFTKFFKKSLKQANNYSENDQNKANNYNENDQNNVSNMKLPEICNLGCPAGTSILQTNNQDLDTSGMEFTEVCKLESLKKGITFQKNKQYLDSSSNMEFTEAIKPVCSEKLPFNLVSNSNLDSSLKEVSGICKPESVKKNIFEKKNKNLQLSNMDLTGAQKLNHSVKEIINNMNDTDLDSSNMEFTEAFKIESPQKVNIFQNNNKDLKRSFNKFFGDDCKPNCSDKVFINQENYFDSSNMEFTEAFKLNNHEKIVINQETRSNLNSSIMEFTEAYKLDFPEKIIIDQGNRPDLGLSNTKLTETCKLDFPRKLIKTDGNNTGSSTMEFTEACKPQSLGKSNIFQVNNHKLESSSNMELTEPCKLRYLEKINNNQRSNFDLKSSSDMEFTEAFKSDGLRNIILNEKTCHIIDSSPKMELTKTLKLDRIERVSESEIKFINEIAEEDYRQKIKKDYRQNNFSDDNPVSAKIENSFISESEIRSENNYLENNENDHCNLNQLEDECLHQELLNEDISKNDHETKISDGISSGCQFLDSSINLYLKNGKNGILTDPGFSESSRELNKTYESMSTNTSEKVNGIIFCENVISEANDENMGICDAMNLDQINEDAVKDTSKQSPVSVKTPEKCDVTPKENECIEVVGNNIFDDISHISVQMNDVDINPTHKGHPLILEAEESFRENDQINIFVSEEMNTSIKTQHFSDFVDQSHSSKGEIDIIKIRGVSDKNKDESSGKKLIDCVINEIAEEDYRKNIFSDDNPVSNIDNSFTIDIIKTNCEGKRSFTESNTICNLQRCHDSIRKSEINFSQKDSISNHNERAIESKSVEGKQENFKYCSVVDLNTANYKNEKLVKENTNVETVEKVYDPPSFSNLSGFFNKDKESIRIMEYNTRIKNLKFMKNLGFTRVSFTEWRFKLTNLLSIVIELPCCTIGDSTIIKKVYYEIQNSEDPIKLFFANSIKRLFDENWLKSECLCLKDVNKCFNIIMKDRTKMNKLCANLKNLYARCPFTMDNDRLSFYIVDVDARIKFNVDITLKLWKEIAANDIKITNDIGYFRERFARSLFSTITADEKQLINFVQHLEEFCKTQNLTPHQ